MTGIFVRIIRDDRSANVAIEDMTEAEWEEFAASRPDREGWRWARRLALWARERAVADDLVRRGEAALKAGGQEWE